MKKMKSIVSIMLCLVFIVCLLSACKKDDGAATDSSVDTGSKAEVTKAPDAEATVAPTAEKVELKLGIWPEDTLTEQIEEHKQHVLALNATQPNIDVIPSYYKYSPDNFISMAEAGTVPTIFECWYTDTQKLIDAGLVADITDNLIARGWENSMNPTIKDLMSKDGRIYGIPRDGYGLGLYLNLELFEEAGLMDADGLPIYPKTWQELAETAKKIKDTTGQAGFDLLAMDRNAGWHFSLIAWDFGAQLTTVADGKFSANLDSPEAIAAMQYCSDLKWVYDVLTPDPLADGWAEGHANLGTGVAAMYLGANDSVAQPTENYGLPVDKFALVPAPAGPNGDQFVLHGGTPYMFANNATKEEIDAALNYLVIMGKAPVATDEAIAGWRRDYQRMVDTGVPVIPRFPCWVDLKVIDAENTIIDEFKNVDMRLFNDYFTLIKEPGKLHLEEPVEAQSMYQEICNVMQEVLTNKDADIPALMKQADTNFQTIIDTAKNQ